MVHIDEHSDLWSNPYDLPTRSPDISENEYLQSVAVFVNEKCNVGNYIEPAIRSGVVGEVIRIEGEEQIRSNLTRQVGKNSILNLDLDFFSPDLSDIPFELKKQVIYHFLPQVSLVTIATSPFFIDQTEALRVLHELFPGS